MRSFLPLRSLTVKLCIVLFGLVFLSLGVVEFVVVPRLESRLVEARIDRLAHAVKPLRQRIPEWGVYSFDYEAGVVPIAGRYDTRVVFFTRLTPTSLSVFADSTTSKPGPAIAADPIAHQAAVTGRTVRGRVERGGKLFAEVAFPANGKIVLLTTPLRDVLESFALMRRSLLVAGAFALLAAAVVAYAAAWGLTRRLRGLETAAERIAGGDFTEPVVDRGRDEVAQLAAAFENMRERLAHLEAARREFIQNASHELRTPLFSLGGFLELLADEDLDDATRREFIAETREQVARLARLATDLLDLSRLDAGQLEVAEEDVDLCEIARTVADEFGPVADASEHEIDTAAVDGLVASADEQRVLQIARILVQNAIRHTPAGTTVAFETSRDGDAVELAVRDDGPGIPESALPRLFDRFYRAPGGRTSGSGLGLAIARELAAKMKGSLRVRSRPGETVFSLRLPAAAEAFQRENGAPAADETPVRA